jgi:hypothetical protein
MMKYPHIIPDMSRRLYRLRRPSALRASSHPGHPDLHARLAAVSSTGRSTLISNLFSLLLQHPLRKQNLLFSSALSLFQRFLMRLRHSLTMTPQTNTVHIHPGFERIQSVLRRSLVQTLRCPEILMIIFSKTRISFLVRTRTLRLQSPGLQNHEEARNVAYLTVWHHVCIHRPLPHPVLILCTRTMKV